MKTSTFKILGLVVIFLIPTVLFAATISNQSIVAIRLFGDDQVSSIQVANNSSFIDSKKYSYSDEKSVISWDVCFPTTTCSRGLKTVYVRYLDSNGQVLGTATQQVDYQKPVPKNETSPTPQRQLEPIIPVPDVMPEMNNTTTLEVQSQKILMGGCTDSAAKNYTTGNDYNDGSCIYQQYRDTSSETLTTGIVAGIAQTIILVAGFGIRFAELPLIISRFFSQVLIFVGARKKPKHWGRVVDSVSGAGLDPVLVTLFDQSDQEVKNTITDIEGRFGFLIPAGSYRLTAQKTHYEFPATHGYQGEWITIHTDDITAIDIPLKNIQNDWNEQEKKRTLPFWKIYRKVIHKFFFIILLLICTYSIYQFVKHPTTAHGISVMVNGLFLLLSSITRQARSFGLVYDKEKRQPITGTIAITHTATPAVLIKKIVINEQGKYYCLLSNGNYQVSITDTTGTTIHTEHVTVRGSILKKDFIIPLLAK